MISKKAMLFGVGICFLWMLFNAFEVYYSRYYLQNTPIGPGELESTAFLTKDGKVLICEVSFDFNAWKYYQDSREFKHARTTLRQSLINQQAFFDIRNSIAMYTIDDFMKATISTEFPSSLIRTRWARMVVDSLESKYITGIFSVDIYFPNEYKDVEKEKQIRQEKARHDSTQQQLSRQLSLEKLLKKESSLVDPFKKESNLVDSGGANVQTRPSIKSPN